MNASVLPLYVLIVVQGLLECGATAAVGLVSWRVKFNWRQLATIAIVLFISAQITRRVLLFGLHIIANMFILLFINQRILSLPFWPAARVTFSGFFLFLLVEQLVMVYIVAVLKVRIADITGDIGTRTLYGMLSPILLSLYCLAVLGLRKARKRGQDASEKASTPV